MNIEQLRDFCLNLKGSSEGFPFNETVLVFKVMGKIFLFANLEGDFQITIKNDPEKIISLREEYPSVKPGYHVSKKYWNTIDVDGSIKDQLMREWIVESYESVEQSLTRKLKEELKNL